MDTEKKQKIIHYITELSIGLIGIIIFILLFWFKNFELSFNLITIWVLFFNIALLFFWLWTNNYKNWEKSFIILYFVLIEFIIIKSIYP